MHPVKEVEEEVDTSDPTVPDTDDAISTAAGDSTDATITDDGAADIFREIKGFF